MNDYNEYLNKLKEYQVEADFDGLRHKIDQRVSRKTFGLRLALAGAVAVLLLGFTTYFYYPTEQASNEDALMSYVFEHDNTNGPLTTYVFE